MPQENIEEVPVIQSLNRFAEKLAPEHREELFKTAQAFLCIGGINGMAVASAAAAAVITGSVITGGTSEASEQKEFMVYLSKKAEEARKNLQTKGAPNEPAV